VLEVSAPSPGGRPPVCGPESIYSTLVLELRQGLAIERFLSRGSVRLGGTGSLTASTAIPTVPGWRFEVKHDGLRKVSGGQLPRTECGGLRVQFAQPAYPLAAEQQSSSPIKEAG
jgi:hypothetical protein